MTGTPHGHTDTSAVVISLCSAQRKGQGKTCFTWRWFWFRQHWNYEYGRYKQYNSSFFWPFSLLCLSNRQCIV